MLVVDPERRFTIDQCLSHPWMTASTPGVNDSTGGLVGGIAGLDVNRRGVPRERTLLSSLNSVQVARIAGGQGEQPINVYTKNPKGTKWAAPGTKESRPADHRHAGEFMEMGGKGDEALFGTDGNSYYSKNDIVADKTRNGTKEQKHQHQQANKGAKVGKKY